MTKEQLLNNFERQYYKFDEIYREMLLTQSFEQLKAKLDENTHLYYMKGRYTV